MSAAAQEVSAAPVSTRTPASNPEKTILTSGGIPATAAAAEPSHSSGAPMKPFPQLKLNLGSQERP